MSSPTCESPRRSLLNSIKRMFWTLQLDSPGAAPASPGKMTTSISFPAQSPNPTGTPQRPSIPGASSASPDKIINSLPSSIQPPITSATPQRRRPPGATFASPEKLISSISLVPQSPIASATPQRPSAAVENARRLLQKKAIEPDVDSSSTEKEEVLFSPATWRYEDEEHGEAPSDHEAELRHQKPDHKHEQAELDHDDDSDYEFCPYRFIKSLPRVDTIAMSHPPVLPAKDAEFREKMTLVLDLDETLVHCSVEPIENSELTFPVLHCGTEYRVHLRRRPFFKEFCEQVSQWFEVVIFTASQRVYANRLLDILDPNKTYFQHRLFRDHCHFYEGNYLKDLRVLNRDLKRVAIIDNSVQAFGLHLGNGIPVESWFSEEHDRELMLLLPFLEALRHSADVRPQIHTEFRLQDVVNSL